jgi:hypothetical protein
VHLASALLHLDECLAVFAPLCEETVQDRLARQAREEIPGFGSNSAQRTPSKSIWG